MGLNLFRQLWLQKWHPDRWSIDPSAAEAAKIRFQQIQEAYAVLSDETKRALYDAGMYDSSEDTDAFCDFLDEISSLMENAAFQSNEEDELEELQEMYIKMLQENWFSTDDLMSESPSESDHQKPIVSDSEYATEEKEEPSEFNSFLQQLHHERSPRKQ